MKLGYIQDGKYHKNNSHVELPSTSSTYKSWDHDQQRQEHQWEIIQPWTRTGLPNPEFAEAYPDEAEQYGFIPKEEN